MRTLGYAPWSPREGIELGMRIGQLHFLSDEQLVVTFVAHEVPGILPRRDRPETSSNLELHALFVDAETGRLAATREWPTFSERSRVAPAGGGKFVVITPDKLSLYSHQLELLKEVDLPVGREATANDWNVERSPGGGYLLVSFGLRSTEDNPHGWLGAEVKRELFDAGTLQVNRTWTETGVGIKYFEVPSDDGSVFTTDRRGALVFGFPGGPWRPADLNWSSQCEPSRGLLLIGNQAVFGWGAPSLHQWCYSLILMNGQLLFTEKLADGEIPRLIASSVIGEGLAVSIDRSRGGSDLLDTPPRWFLSRVVVYSVPTHRWILVLDGKRERLKSISALALSPDGSRLALIDQDGVLRVYGAP